MVKSDAHTRRDKAPRMLLAGALVAVVAFAACTHTVERVQRPPRSVALTTTGPWSSMIYLARTDRGVIVIDLGWFGAEDALRKGLERLGATREDVVAVFLTHSHRDHITGWKLLHEVPFYLAAAEVPRFLGAVSHGGPVPRIAHDVLPADRPEPGEVEIRAFSTDTAFAFGADTVRAFLVPGHTAGSVAYLFRHVLFAGDAITHMPLLGFGEAMTIYSDDVARSEASVASLRERLERFEVRQVCTAHGTCAAADSSFWRNLLR